MAPRRSSIVLRESRFRSDDCEEAYNRLKEWEFSDSKILRQDTLSYPISEYFVNTPLLFILTLAYPYHSDFVREFFANLTIEPGRQSIKSRVLCRNVVISKEDVGRYLSTTVEGPRAHDIATSLQENWTSINLVLRDSNYPHHIGTVTGLVPTARVIQHVLRHTIIPKAGDRTNITPLLSVVTYYCMTSTSFDVGDLLFRYLENILVYLDPRSKRRHNLALGHIISHIILLKYDISVPSTFDRPPSFFSDSSFHMLVGRKKARGKRPMEEEEEEEAGAHEQGETSAPPSSTSDDISSRLGRLEVQVAEQIRISEERWQADRTWFQEQFEENRRSSEERSSADRAWFQAQFDSLRRNYPPPDDS